MITLTLALVIGMLSVGGTVAAQEYDSSQYDSCEEDPACDPQPPDDGNDDTPSDGDDGADDQPPDDNTDDRPTIGEPIDPTEPRIIPPEESPDNFEPTEPRVDLDDYEDVVDPSVNEVIGCAVEIGIELSDPTGSSAPVAPHCHEVIEDLRERYFEE